MRCRLLDGCGRSRCLRKVCPLNSASGETTSTSYCAKKRSYGLSRLFKIFREQITEALLLESGPTTMTTTSRNIKKTSRPLN